MIARRASSPAWGQAAISANDRPQPMHQRPSGSSRQRLMHGDATRAILDPYITKARVR